MAKAKKAAESRQREKQKKPQRKAFSLTAGGEQISFRVPKEWLGVADRIAAESTLGATRTSVFRAALLAGLEALGGKAVE